MTDNAPVQSRDERLAAKLRENLRRRKAPAREMGQRDEAAEVLPNQSRDS